MKNESELSEALWGMYNDLETMKVLKEGSTDYRKSFVGLMDMMYARYFEMDKILNDR